MSREKFLRRLWVLLLLAGTAPAAWAAQLDSGVAKPPVARKEPHTMSIHGDTRVDPYFWLRQKTNPEVISYLEAENAYTKAVMRPTEALQETLYKEMLGRIKQTDLSVPYRIGGWLYYTRTEKGKQYPIHCRRRNPNGAEQVVLDLNEMAKGHKFLSLGAYVVSDDANLLAYSTDTTGFREYLLQIKDLRTGRTLPERFPRVTSVAWAADNQTLFFVSDDRAKRPYRLNRHVLGQNGADVIYEEKDELYRLMCRRSRDRAYLFASSQSSITSETRCLASGEPKGEWRVLLPRQEGHEYYVDHRGDQFYIRTNQGAKNFRLVTAAVKDPRPDNWKEIIAHRADVYLEGVQLFAHHTVVEEREQGLQRMRIFDDAGKSHTVQFDEPTYALMPDTNPEFETDVFRFRYQSPITPDSVYDYDMKTGERKLLKRTEVLGGYDPSQYKTERVFATAPDSVRVPISLVYRKGLKRDGTAPMLLYGYGSYGISIPDSFQSQRISLLDRGVVFAVAHIRGGGEMGRAWHDQGKMMHKRNTFTDFIAAADYLVAEKYAARARLAIEGRSAGGLLIGAVVNIRPDLCKCAILGVPFVDVINTMLDPSLPLTVQEYLEWGNPNNQSEYEYMKSYCPYTNVASKDYPAMLVFTSLNDSQVMYWEPAKFTAKLRAAKTDHNPLLLRVNMAAGHGGASGRYDALKEAAFIYSFVLTEIGAAE